MKLSRRTRAGIAVVMAVGLAGLGLGVPSQAATRTTVVVVQSNAMTSLNSSTPDTNVTVNSDISYITNSGFLYYDNKPSLVRNTVFGSYKVVKKDATDFRVKYTVNKGRVWSDGTPITGVDLLMSHVLSSSEWSKAAGLGDPGSETGAAFDSLGYGGVYDSFVVGNPTLSADKMSVTIRYKAFQPDWEIIGPGPSAVHTLVLLAEGKKGLQSVAANNAAKARFLAAYNAKNTDLFKKIAKIWNDAYDIKTINKNTNKLLLVSNGAYQVTSAVAEQSTTMTLNPRYNSGPKTNGVTKIVFRYLTDGMPSAQALSNGEIDIYSGQPTADSVALLKLIGKRIRIIGGTNSCFEHIDLRSGPAFGTDQTYNGPFAGYGQKATDLRKAFLLAYPREKIVNDLVKPINPKAVLVNSAFLLPGQPGYSTVVANSGVSTYTAGTQASRTAAALALVKKYYPNASATNPEVDVKLLWGRTNNQRRASEFAIVSSEAKKAGFNVINSGMDSWGANLDSSSYDAAFFAWCPTSLSQTGTNANFQSDGSNNYTGYNNPEMDKILKKLEGFLSPAQITAQYLAADKLLAEQAITLGIFQHPAVTAVNAKLKNVKPAPLSPTLVWNFWEWKY